MKNIQFVLLTVYGWIMVFVLFSANPSISGQISVIGDLSVHSNLTSESNVGIGTTDPKAALHILSNLPPPDSLPTREQGLLMGVSGPTSYKWIQSYGGILALNPQGNQVGIGTDTPFSTLTLGGPIGFTNADTPMFYMYAFGAANPRRMVVSHSPAFPTWGIQYRDFVESGFPSDSIEFVAGGKPSFGFELFPANLTMYDPGTHPSILIESDAKNSAGRIAMLTDNGSPTVEIWAKSRPGDHGSRVALHRSDGTPSITLEAEKTRRGKAELVVQGSLGVGDSPEERLLVVKGSSWSDEMVQLSSSRIPTRGEALLEVKAPETASPFRFFLCRRASKSVFEIRADGGVQASGQVHAGGSDFAEMIEINRDEGEPGPGDVMVLDPQLARTVRKSTSARSIRVAGVFSTQPGFVGAPSPSEVPSSRAEQMIPLAVVGIVPCKVSAENGPIAIGDLLVSAARPGHAMREDHPSIGTVLGKAMEALVGDAGVIEVLVTLQ